MVNAVLASAWISSIYFYVSAQNTINEVYRKLFMFLGFAMVLATFGLELSGVSDTLLATVIFSNAAIFGLLLMVEALQLIVKAIQTMTDRGR